MSLAAEEADLLRRLTGEMRSLLDEPGSHPAVEGRLFPDAHEDAAEAQAYRDLVGEELRRDKIATLEALGTRLGPSAEVDITLARDEAEGWLTALTDLRLALGVRLDVTEEKMGAEIDVDDPRAAGMMALHWLGYLQESMLAAMDPYARRSEVT